MPRKISISSLNQMIEDIEDNPSTLGLRELKRSDALRGKPLSEAHRKSLSRAKRGKPLTDEHKLSLRKAMSSAGTQKNLSNAAKDKWTNPEYRRKVRIGMTVPLTSEQKARYKEALGFLKKNPETSVLSVSKRFDLKYARILAYHLGKGLTDLD